MIRLWHKQLAINRTRKDLGNRKKLPYETEALIFKLEQIPVEYTLLHHISQLGSTFSLFVY